MQSTILRRTGRAFAAGSAVLALVLAGQPAFAKDGEAGDDGGGTTAGTPTGSSAGDFAVTVNGTTYDPAAGRDVRSRRSRSAARSTSLVATSR